MTKQLTTQQAIDSLDNLLTTKNIADIKNMKVRAVQKFIERHAIPIAMVVGRNNLIHRKYLKLFDNRQRGNPHKK